MDWKSFLRSFSLCAACLKVKVGYSAAAAPKRGCPPINPTTPPKTKPAASEKIRRQKRRRSRRAQARMLADKSHHAAKKQARRPVTGD
jgi:hypothetical protein